MSYIGDWYEFMRYLKGEIEYTQSMFMCVLIGILWIQYSIVTMDEE